MLQDVRRELKDLYEHRGTCLSLYLPTERTGKETRQNSIRLKNLVRSADEELKAQGMRSLQRDRYLLPIRDLVDDFLFWQHQNHGLAVFRSEEFFRAYRLPASFQDLAVATERFHLKPILSLLGGDGEFYVLAISQNRVRLLSGSRFEVDEVELENVPTSLADALRFDDPEKSLQFHTGTQQGGMRPAMYFGQGVGTDKVEHKKNLVRYFQQVDAGLREYLRLSRAPLVFAGVEYLLPLYKEANSYAGLLDEVVGGNPDEIPADVLHRRCWELVEPWYRRDMVAAVERLREADGTGLSTSDVGEAMLAAHHGRLEFLFVPVGQHVWGRFDEPSEKVEIHEEKQSGDEDLLDLAALKTILQGGAVHAVPPMEMPAGRSIAALFRY